MYRILYFNHKDKIYIALGVMTMAKKVIGVIFGGASSEYEVSLRSASSVLRNFPYDDCDAVMIGITKDGRWYRYNGNIDDIENDAWVKNAHPAIISPDRGHHGIIDENGNVTRLDAVFPVIHGKNCEDGTLQGLLTIAGIPFVGCDTMSSAICMDKVLTHTVLDAAGIKTADWFYAVEGDMADFDKIEAEVKARLSYPVFVKPANAGSSVGVSKASDKNELKKALLLAFENDKKAVIEKAIIGREIECAVLGNLEPIASVPGEIAPKAEFYDYNAKYADNSTELYIPARLDEALTEKVRTTAVLAYKKLFCSGLSRVDFFVTEGGEVILNEINTLPGFTSISMYPKLFGKSGIPYAELIKRLIDLSLERKFLI